MWNNEKTYTTFHVKTVVLLFVNLVNIHKNVVFFSRLRSIWKIKFRGMWFYCKLNGNFHEHVFTHYAFFIWLFCVICNGFCAESGEYYVIVLMMQFDSFFCVCLFLDPQQRMNKNSKWWREANICHFSGSS